MAQDSNLSLLYAHWSRMYNSAISVLTSFIVGWPAFFVLAVSIILDNSNSFTKQIGPITLTAPLVIRSIGIVIVIMSSYFLYFRILQLGRWIYMIEESLGLRNYCDNLQKLPLVGLNLRRNSNEFTRGEILGILIFSIYFGAPLFVLLFVI